MPAHAPHRMPRWQAACLALGLHALVLVALLAASGHGDVLARAISARLVMSGPAAPTPLAKPVPQMAQRHKLPRPPPVAPFAPAPTPAISPAAALAAPSDLSQPSPSVAVTPAAKAGGADTTTMATPAVAAIAAATDANTLVYDASYRHKPEPDYPWMAKRLNQEGVAKVAVQVGSDGQAQAVRLIQSSGFRVLDDAAQTALLHCHDCFVPPQRDGQPVPGWALVPMVFRLQG